MQICKGPESSLSVANGEVVACCALRAKACILTWVCCAPGLLRQFGVLCLRRHDESSSELVPLKVFKSGVKWCMSCLLTIMGLHLRI